MSKTSIYLYATTSSMVVFADLPIFFLFGLVFVGILIELKKIQKKVYPIISNVFLSSIIGWATSFAIKKHFPTWFEGDIKVFSMLMTTLFAYGIILYFFKNETVQKLAERILNKKFTQDDSSSNN